MQQNITRQLLKEIFWFAFAGLVSFAIVYFLFGLSNSAFDIHIRDTIYAGRLF
jgi:Trk-type K+ transport system membrane component